MKRFNQANFDLEVTEFIRNWTKLLSEGKFQEACEQLDPPLKLDYFPLWTKEMLKSQILERWENGTPIINNPYEMDLTKEKICFYPYNDNSGTALEYDLPLNGEWNDLTAQFSFKKQSADHYYVILDDIHVLYASRYATKVHCNTG